MRFAMSAALLASVLLATVPFSRAQYPSEIMGAGLSSSQLNGLLINDFNAGLPPTAAKIIPFSPPPPASPPQPQQESPISPPPPVASPPLPPRKLLSPPPPLAYSPVQKTALSPPPAPLGGIGAAAPVPVKSSNAVPANAQGVFDPCANFSPKKYGFLETPWTKELNTTLPRTAYPRPQMKRDDASWVNLNGRYQFFPVEADAQPPFNQVSSQCILVPFPMEAPLSGIAEHHTNSFYSRQFTLPGNFAGKTVLLHANRVDREATYFVNGIKVGSHVGGYSAHSIDITQAVRSEGANELVIGVYDPTEESDVNFPLGKQRSGKGAQAGITYTSSSGPWSTVWLEAVPAAYISSVQPFPDLAKQQVAFELSVSDAAKDATAIVTVTDSTGATVGSGSGPVSAPLFVAVPSPAPWSPDSPTLYNAHIALASSAVATQSLDSSDAVDVYFGFSQVTKGITTLGIPHMRFNNEANGTFLAGPLYQGHFSDGVYAGASDDQYADIIKKHKALGFNLIRIHAKVEDPQFYYQADKLGIYIMQDIPAPCGHDPLSTNTFPNCWVHERNSGWTDQSKQQLVDEATEITKEARTHPSIIALTAFNEGWGQTRELTERVVGALTTNAPDKMINEASGWVYYGHGDIVDLHHYSDANSPINKPWLESFADPGGEPQFKNYNETSPAVFAYERIPILGEFGGWGRYIPGHFFNGLTSCPMAYNENRDISAEDLTSNVIRLWQQVVAFAQKGELGAAVYTEINDQEGECNGMWDFSWSVMKLTSEDALIPTFQDISAAFAQAVHFV